MYFRVETLENITAYESGDEGWMNNETSVSRYTAGGEWEEIGKGEVYVSGNVMQVRVKLSDLGMSAEDYYMEFKVTDNIQKEKDFLSLYSTGDAAPIGRLSYTYGY